MKPSDKAGTGSAGRTDRSRTPGRAGIISLGCPKNLVDTEYLLGDLRRAGWTFTADPGRADLLLVNTCAFIEGAVRESEEAIEEVLARKKKRRGVRVVVAGCLVNRAGSDLARRYPGVDVFLRPGDIPRLARLLSNAGDPRPPRAGSRGFVPPAGQERACTTGPWAYLKISDGCDNRCGYCLIPAIRGAQRSRALASVVAEARRLVAKGVRELNVVAQDITRWRGAREQGLRDLLRALLALPGDFRLRLLYLHPARVSPELIGFLADQPRIFPYLDLPIQHASDRILRAMNRPYSRRSLGRIYRDLRRRIPGISLRTTVMVGYPGEGRREFESLLSFLRDHPFDNLGAFTFSPQEGTPAWMLPGAVGTEEAAERYHQVMTAQALLSAPLWAARRGRMVEAIIETPDPGAAGVWLGRTAWQAPEVDGVLRASGQGRPGALARVRITGSGAYDLEGVISGK
jgi:ribosomal protein S12 methylthiotransferase